MPTHVYANGREIACQAADGIASVAFPDPCWSPPAPPAGPVVIPYPNTARPKSLKNGSCTVFICGKPVALEDHSYFSTSTGNEAATQAFGKGVATGVIKGKAHHRSWSMDVMIEGRGVARHTDLMTHNHGGAVPGNTPMFPYLSRKAQKKNCKDEAERIGESCKTDENKHWTKTHCNGLGEMLDEKVKAEPYINKHKADLGSKASDLDAFIQQDPMLASMIGRANRQTVAKQFAGFKDVAEDFKSFDKLSPTEKKKRDLKIASSGQAMLATLNACTLARKCILVPYANKGKNGAEPSTDKGCCDGQTGHHLIYDKMVVKKNNCPNYRKGDAPTVCVEGFSQHHGTHGRVHKEMDKAVGRMVKNKRATDGNMNTDCVIDAAADSHAEAFPLSGCSRKCIKAQLESYYKNDKVCKSSAQFKTIDKQGQPHTPCGAPDHAE